MPVTMADVAKRAGVSIATVSNVITGKRYVSDLRKQLVQKAIDELGYTVNLTARGLKQKRTYTIAVIVPEVSMIFFADVIKGISDAAAKANYTINILNTNWDFKKEKELVRQLADGRVDGIILDSFCDIDCLEDWETELVKIQQKAHGVPIVCIEGFCSNLLTGVKVDYKEATAQCVEYLYKLGRRKIIYISPPLNIYLGIERLNGYQIGMERVGLPYKKEYVLEGDFSTVRAYNEVKKFLNTRLEFDAIVSGNDHSVIGALKALRENNIKVPEDVSLVGFDNLFPTTLVNPQITTVDVPRYDIGYQAFSILLDKINNKNQKAFTLVLNTRLIERRSTNPLAKEETSLYRW